MIEFNNNNNKIELNAEIKSLKTFKAEKNVKMSQSSVCELSPQKTRKFHVSYLPQTVGSNRSIGNAIR